MADEKKNLLRRLKTSADVGRFMADYYYELDDASKKSKKKIAWCSSVGPAEILRAMGFLIYFPETHSAMLGATRKSTDLIPVANALGYSPEICSYLTADIGAFYSGYTPLAEIYKGIESIPRPDVIVFNNNQCRDVQDWFAWYAKRFDVPMIGIHTPRNIEDVSKSHIVSIIKQMENIIEPLEKIAGKKFNMDDLKETVGLSKQCSRLWSDILNTASVAPSPITFFDGSTLMGPAVVGRGTNQAIDVYKLLLEELEERIEKGVGTLKRKERFRIYWDGMPVWGRLSTHSKLFASLDANVLASTYCSSWIFNALDPENLFESMARAYTELFIVRSDEYKEEYLEEKLNFFHIDGIIYHSSRTCPNNSNALYGMPQRLEKKTKIPCLTIDGDFNDLRCLSDEQTNTKVEAFIEQIEERK